MSDAGTEASSPFNLLWRLLFADFQREYICFGCAVLSYYLHLHANTDGEGRAFLQAMSDKKARGRQMLRLLNLIE